MAARVDRLVPRRRARRASALVLYRQLPKVKRYLAYLPEGPVIDWDDEDLESLAGRRWSTTSRGQGAFGIRMGPPGRDAAAGTPRRSRTASPTRPCAGSTRCRRRSASPRRAGRLAAARARLAPAARPRAGSPPASRSTTSRSRCATRTAGAHRGRRAQGHEPAVAPQHQEGRQGGRRHRAGPGRRSSRPAASDFHDLYVHTAERDHFTPAAAELLRDDVPRPRRRGPRPDRALHRRARGRPGRRHDPDPGRRPRLVLLRRLLHREARRPRLQRRAVGDDPARARRRAPTSTTCAASPTPSTPTTATSG